MATMDYRRPLTRKERLMSLGAGLAAAAAGTYLARILLQREPLKAAAPAPPGGAPDVASSQGR